MEPEEIAILAEKIFAKRVAQLSTTDWDFEPIANKAFDAAEAFSDVLDARMPTERPTPPPPAQTQSAVEQTQTQGTTPAAHVPSRQETLQQKLHPS